jgi:hypothetical protein
MTRRERIKRLKAIRDQIGRAGERLHSALSAMDYEKALVIQIQIDGLVREERHMARRESHTLYPPREASYAALSMLFSGYRWQSGSDKGGC